jgi:hypothetical protein
MGVRRFGDLSASATSRIGGAAGVSPDVKGGRFRTGMSCKHDAARMIRGEKAGGHCLLPDLTSPSGCIIYTLGFLRSHIKNHEARKCRKMIADLVTGVQNRAAAMGAPTHSETLEIPAKTHRYGRWGVVRNAETTGFPGRDALFQKRGVGTEGSKLRFPARKARSLWFYPPQTTRIFAQTEPNDAQNL